MTPSRMARFGLLVLVGLALLIAPVMASAFVLDLLFEAVSFAIYATLGGLIIARRDGHITGWLLTLIGLLLAFNASVTYLAGPTAFLGQWVGSWGWTAVFALFATLTLTFPSGQPPQGPGPWARAGRAALWLLPALVVASTLTETLGGLRCSRGHRTPLASCPSG